MFGRPSSAVHWHLPGLFLACLIVACTSNAYAQEDPPIEESQEQEGQEQQKSAQEKTTEEKSEGEAGEKAAAESQIKPPGLMLDPEPRQRSNGELFNTRGQIIKESLTLSKIGDHEKAVEMMEALFVRLPNDAVVKQQLLRRVSLAANNFVTGGKREQGYQLYLRAAEVAKSLLTDVPADKALAYKAAHAATIYNEACALNLAGETEKAIESIRMAIDWGFKDMGYLMNDNDLGEVADSEEIKVIFGDALTTYRSKFREVVQQQLAGFQPIQFDAELPDLRNRNFRFSEYTGKVVFVTFWSTGNIRSCKNLATFSRFQKNYAEKDIKIFAVGCEKGQDPAAKIAAHFKENSVPYTCLVANTKIKRQLKSTHGFPVTLVMDREGKTRVILPDQPNYITLASVADLLLEEK